MSKRNLLIAVLLIAGAAAALFFLYPCGSGERADAPAGQAATQSRTVPPGKKPAIEPQDKSAPVTTNVPPAAHEIDNAPPVKLTGSEELPNVAKCATANFPGEAKPYVKLAIVTVRLVVDKFGNVRSDTPISVDFADEIDEEILPRMRKLFIEAGSHAFGAKKCPPHVVNGENVGYAIEVPLQYKH